MGARTTTINGVVPSSSDVSIEVKLNGGGVVKIVDLKTIDWSREVEIGEKRRMDGTVGGSTRGRSKNEGAMSLFEEAWAELETALMSVNRQISLVQFQVNALWTPPLAVRQRKAIIPGCRIVGDAVKNADNVDATVFDIKLYVPKVLSFPDARGNSNTLIGEP